MKDSVKPEEMHKDFFDRCGFAIANRFYMEAIMMEYAAMEARLEVVLGVFGSPCNRYADNKVRKEIQISHRVGCCDRLRKKSELFEKTKLPPSFFEKLSDWINKRNEYIHGLYKNELVYGRRMNNAKRFAEKGYEYCRLLYNEVNRLKRLRKKYPELFEGSVVCSSQKCKYCISK